MHLCGRLTYFGLPVRNVSEDVMRGAAVIRSVTYGLLPSPSGGIRLPSCQTLARPAGAPSMMSRLEAIACPVVPMHEGLAVDESSENQLAASRH
jgi:hypothetical protein